MGGRGGEAGQAQGPRAPAKGLVPAHFSTLWWKGTSRQECSYPQKKKNKKSTDAGLRCP